MSRDATAEADYNWIATERAQTVARERPTKGLPDCRALQCSYPGLPAGATVLIAPEADIGGEPLFGGDCAGTNIAPCRLTMNQDKNVSITFNGSG